MNDDEELTPSQKDFLARACAFIASNPSREDLDRLLTFAALQLPDAVVELLRRRAAAAGHPGAEESGLARWLQ
jgi:hypothetical protein